MDIAPAPTYEEFAIGGLYPTAGPSLGIIGSASNVGGIGRPNSASPAGQAQMTSDATTLFANKFAGFATLAALLVILWFISHHLAKREAGDFANPKITFWYLVTLGIAVGVIYPLEIDFFIALQNFGVPGAANIASWLRAR